MAASHPVALGLVAGETGPARLIRTEYPPYKFSAVGDYTGGPILIQHSPDAGLPQKSAGRWITLGSIGPGGGDLDILMPVQNVRAVGQHTSGTADVYFMAVGII
jgi:hypothetical protein